MHTSPCGKSRFLCFVFLIVFLLPYGCQCSLFLPSGAMGWSVHTSLLGGSVGWYVHISPTGKSWLLNFNCVFEVAVVWLSVLCVSSWWFYGLVCAHISLWKELVALFCVLNCVLAVVWLSVFFVSNWLFHGLVCVLFSL